MKKTALTLGLGLLLNTQYASAGIPQGLLNQQTSLAPMLKSVTPAIVNLRVLVKLNEDKKDLEKQMPFGLGSGVIVDAKKGYIITNHHVIKNAQDILVTLDDKRQLDAKLIGSDADSDVALIQIDSKNLIDLPFANISNSSVGDFVVAIGNPFGLSQTVTSGIISGLGRNIGIEGFEDFIQTDAPINPGNSGGALVNLNGELVGINTAILSPEGGNIGIGFAIPSNMVQGIMQQLIKYGEVRRGTLGVMAQNLTPDLATGLDINTEKGALVAVVVPDGLAQSAGIQIGDIITEVNGKAINNSSDLKNSVGLIQIDSPLDMTVLRNGKELRFSTTMTDPKKLKTQAAQLSPALAGATLAPIEKSIQNFGDVKGVEVLSVDPNSQAWRNGLRPHDIIYIAFDKQVKDLNDLTGVLKKHKNKANKSLVTLIIRKNLGLYVTLKDTGTA